MSSHIWCGLLTNLPLLCFLTALAIGACAEGAAMIFGLWTYRSRTFLLLNILVTFGIVEGLGVGWVIGGRQMFLSIAPVLFMVGAVVGILVEGLNEYWWRGSIWPDRPLLGIERSIDKAAFVGVAWGFVPVFTVAISRLVISSGWAA